MKKQLLSLLLLLLMGSVFSCKKPDSTSPANTPKLTADDTNPYPYEVVSLSGNNITYNHSSYTGTIGSTTVTFALNGTDLNFIVPELNAGSYDVKLNVEGTNYTVTLNVKDKPTVSDPVGYIDDLHKQAINTLGSVQTMMKDMAPYFDTTTIGADIRRMDKMYSDAISKYNSLSAADQLKAAQFFVANRAWINDLHDAVSHMLTSSGTVKIRQTLDNEGDQQATYSDIEAQWGKVKKSVGKALFAFAGFSLIGLPQVGAFVGLVVVMKEVNTMLTLVCKGITVTSESETVSANKKATVLNFRTGESTTHFVTVNFRSLTKNDVGTTQGLIKSFIPLVDELNGWVDKFNALVSADYQLKGKNESISSISAPYATGIRIGASKYFSVKNISNPNVSFKGLADSSNFIGFTFVNSDTAEQTFTFDLVYENPGITQSTINISGKVSHGDNSMLYLTGNSSKSWVIDPAGRSTSCGRLVNPPCMADNVYTYSANGTFSYNPGSVTKCDASCSDGNASTQSFHFSTNRKQLIVGSTSYNITRLTATSLRMTVGSDEYDLIPK